MSAVPKPMPANGSTNNAMLLAALRVMSDSCELPDLTPECPYSEVLADGSRGCTEQCMDLLAEHEVPLRGPVIRMSDSIAIIPRRSRSRRNPTATITPFDVQRLLLEDRQDPNLADWRTSSLIHMLGSMLVFSAEPEVDCISAATNAGLTLAELDRRGIDAELLLRHGLADDIAVSIALAIAVVENSDEIPADFKGLVEWATTWVPLLDATIETPPKLTVAERMIHRLVASLKGTFHERVCAWVAISPIDDIIARAAPSIDTFRLHPPFPSEVETQPHLWLVDRATRTYVDQWRIGSLKFEWQFQRTQRTAPCDDRFLRERRIDQSQLANVLADRSTDPSPLQHPSVGTLLPLAVSHLRAGNRQAAAAVFEVGRTLNPSDAQAHNNYAFCILPDNPAHAIGVLDHAAGLGMVNEPVNIANRIYVRRMLGRNVAALELAEQFTGSWNSSIPAEHGYLWSLSSAGDNPTLESVDARLYIYDLAVQIATESNDQLSLARWVRRRDEYIDAHT